MSYGRCSDRTRGDHDETSAKEARARTRPPRWSTPPLGRHRRSRGRRASRGPEPRSRSRHFRTRPGSGAGRSPARLSTAVGTRRPGPPIGGAGCHLAGDDVPGHALGRADTPADGRTEATPPPRTRTTSRVPPTGIRPSAPAGAQRGAGARHPSRPSRCPRTPARRRGLAGVAHSDAPRAGPMKRAILITALTIAAVAVSPGGAAAQTATPAVLGRPDRLQRLVRGRCAACRGRSPPTSLRTATAVDVHAGRLYPRTCLVSNDNINWTPFSVTMRVDKTVPDDDGRRAEPRARYQRLVHEARLRSGSSATTRRPASPGAAPARTAARTRRRRGSSAAVGTARATSARPGRSTCVTTRRRLRSRA